jgi:hypothetical protein
MVEMCGIMLRSGTGVNFVLSRLVFCAGKKVQNWLNLQKGKPPQETVYRFVPAERHMKAVESIGRLLLQGTRICLVFNICWSYILWGKYSERQC